MDAGACSQPVGIAKAVKAICALLVLAFMLTGCDQSDKGLNLRAELGTKALFRQGTQEFLMEVTAIDGPLVRTEISSNNEILSLRDYYRGLIPVAGTDGGRNFRFSFDTREIDALFPLAVGNSVSVSGTLQVEGFPEPLEVVIQASVTAAKNIALKRAAFDVLVVEIEQIYRGNDGVRTRTDVYYHAPDLSLNLKSVTRGDSFQNYWYVTDITRPGGPASINPRRPGSVMI